MQQSGFRNVSTKCDRSMSCGLVCFPGHCQSYLIQPHLFHHEQVYFSTVKYPPWAHVLLKMNLMISNKKQILFVLSVCLQMNISGFISIPIINIRIGHYWRSYTKKHWGLLPSQTRTRWFNKAQLVLFDRQVTSVLIINDRFRRQYTNSLKFLHKQFRYPYCVVN